MTVPTKSLTLIAGAGPGNGMAFARRFADDGQLALLTRDPRDIAEEAGRLNDTKTYACDVTDGSAVGRTLGDVRARQGEPSTLIYNAGSAKFGSFADITAEKFEESWRINAFGAFLVAREVVPAMQAAGRGDDHLRRRNGIAAWWQRECGVRPSQGGPAQPCAIDGAKPLARGHPRRHDRARRSRRVGSGDRGATGTLRGRLHRSGGGRRDGAYAEPAATFRLDVRNHSSPVPRDLVVARWCRTAIRSR